MNNNSTTVFDPLATAPDGFQGTLNAIGVAERAEATEDLSQVDDDDLQQALDGFPNKNDPGYTHVEVEKEKRLHADITDAQRRLFENEGEAA